MCVFSADSKEREREREDVRWRQAWDVWTSGEAKSRGWVAEPDSIEVFAHSVFDSSQAELWNNDGVQCLQQGMTAISRRHILEAELGGMAKRWS